jgi:hypothetical protein
LLSEPDSGKRSAETTNELLSGKDIFNIFARAERFIGRSSRPRRIFRRPHFSLRALTKPSMSKRFAMIPQRL